MFSYRSNHFPEPKPAEWHDNSVANHKHGGKPPSRSMLQYKRFLKWRVVIFRPKGLLRMQRSPYIGEKHKSEIWAPYEPAACKHHNEDYVVDDLERWAGFVQLVEKLVGVDEGCGDLD